MFAKLHHHQQHQQYQHHPQPHPNQITLDHHLSSEESSGDASRSISKKPKHDPDSERFGTGEGGGGGTIDVTRRPRGRPPGSKNKPKPPLIITREAQSALRPLFLELPTGLDVIDAIARFTHRRNIGLTVLTASGTVTNVSFRQPSVNGAATTAAGAIVTFNGRFEILSISASFLPPSLPITSTSSQPLILPSSFMISLVGPHGQIIGGSVAGSLITAGTVFIVAASFDNPSYHRLPVREVDALHVQNPPNSNTSEDNCDHDGGSSNVLVESCGGGGGGGGNGMSNMYSTCHVPAASDLIWTPTPRQPPPF